ncbi:hypothetical protein EVAR_21406_1 [Eumeta japonica]|uniref:Uncharacterized protein n=1 Tax=Eumeta variegata TaxID=151549 RepID=A0A4C1VHC0_EUMVA|nr:hypothetical protein EVAR_21406_1 [Eumeta japonica]
MVIPLESRVSEIGGENLYPGGSQARLPLDNAIKNLDCAIVRAHKHKRQHGAQTHTQIWIIMGPKKNSSSAPKNIRVCDAHLTI